MNQIKKILHIYPSFNNGGTEHVILNIFKNIDRSKLMFDFLSYKPGNLTDKFISLGGKFHYKNLNDFTEISNFFRHHKEYKIVHVHTCAECGNILKAAKISGVQYRIMHSHISRDDLPNVFSILKLLKNYKILLYSNYWIACSREAAKWQYSIFWKRADIWLNNVNYDTYKFNLTYRNDLRRKLDIPSDAKVICHVGRFVKQKNHPFLIEILNALLKTKGNYYAILVGEGEDFNYIKSIANSDRIIFVKNAIKAKIVYSASDLLLFPSLYEGLPLVPLEAQMSGMCCLLSDKISKSSDLNLGLVKFESIQIDAKKWSDTVIKICEQDLNQDRLKMCALAKNTRGNTKLAVKDIEYFYLVKCNL